jgi:hypothetical protein
MLSYICAYIHACIHTHSCTGTRTHMHTCTHTDKGDKHRQNLSVSSQSSLMCEEEVNTLYLIVTFLYSGHCLHCNILFGRCQVFSHEDAILRKSTGPENTCWRVADSLYQSFVKNSYHDREEPITAVAKAGSFCPSHCLRWHTASLYFWSVARWPYIALYL